MPPGRCAELLTATSWTSSRNPARPVTCCGSARTGSRPATSPAPPPGPRPALLRRRRRTRTRPRHPARRPGRHRAPRPSLLRQYFPRGSDLRGHDPDRLAAVAAELNDRPRKTLGWDTPGRPAGRAAGGRQAASGAARMGSWPTCTGRPNIGGRPRRQPSSPRPASEGSKPLLQDRLGPVPVRGNTGRGHMTVTCGERTCQITW
jgi:hypothetical protein